MEDRLIDAVRDEPGFNIKIAREIIRIRDLALSAEVGIITEQEAIDGLRARLRSRHEYSLVVPK